MTITSENLVALLPLLIIGVAVVVVMLSIAWRRDHFITAAMTIGAMLLALLSLIAVMFVIPQQVTPLMLIDGYAIVYTKLVLIAGIASCLFAYPWLKEYPDNKEEFYLLILIATLGGILLSGANHMAALFIGIELLSLPLFGLIGYAYRKRRSLEAAIKYMILSAAASSFLLFGIALIYAASGTLTFSGLANNLNGIMPLIANLNTPDPMLLSKPLLLTGMGLMLVGLGFKLSLVPFQLWTPDVYQGAPAPVASYLATAGKIAVFCVLARLIIGIQLEGSLLFTLALLALLSILVGNSLALYQNNLKRILGYSSISHLGYLLAALCAVASINATEFGLEVIGVYLLGYLFSSIIAFGVVSVMANPYTTSDNDGLERYRGLFWQRPVLALCLVIAMLSLAGIPLTFGFIGKFYVIMANVSAQLWWLVGVMVIGSAMGLYYYLRVAINLFHRDEGDTSEVNISLKGLTVGEYLIVVLTLAILAMGLYPQPVISLIGMMGLG